MDPAYHGHTNPATRRRPLGDGTSRANQDRRLHSPQHRHKSKSYDVPSSSPKHIPRNESLIQNGSSLAVRHQLPQPSPQHKRVSAVVEESRPRDSKRDSEISNASTVSSSVGGRKRKTHIGPWQLGKTIGRGGCSRVRIVRHSATGQLGAAKIISKSMADKVRALSLANLAASAENDVTLFPGEKTIPFGLEREICIMKLLDHPNIVRLYDIWENRSEIYLIMEYVEGGELFGYLGEHGTLPEDVVVYIFRQIVAALIYCHRINIHHRDLKPENILLDRSTMNIKLVDFGMAALQPEGKKLTTPCGSPHYAAPEVIKTKPYDGGQADVWSCGVVLFVLLAGTPPFNYSGDERDLRALFEAISRAEYQMPQDLSSEAKDLISRILITDPKQRITLKEIWNHPFLRKYDDDPSENLKLEYWVGPEPSLQDWKPLSRSTIERDIMRYMRTLWHSETEEALVQRLLSKSMNFEKYFYMALQKYQHDQLENYVPNPENAVAYSTSDYHHNKRFGSPREGSSPPNDQKRSQSVYSILNNEHLYSKHSFYGKSPSQVSYDPFRASKEPIVPMQSFHQNITVHRGSSSATRSLRPPTALGHHTRSTLRVQAMTRNSAFSRASSKRSTPSSNRSARSTHTQRRSMSRSSLMSSHYSSSPPMFRTHSMHRRGVSFSRLRRSSNATASTNDTATVNYTPEQRRYLSQFSDYPRSPSMSPGSSTMGDSPTVRVASKAAAAVPVVPRLKIRKPESPSKYIQTEVRKVSTELGKVMEEAFNRSSISSSVETSTFDPQKDVSGSNTPPTSLSNHDSGGTVTLESPSHTSVYRLRPLPPLPNETPNAFLKRKLAETRAEIERQFAENEQEDSEHLHDVLRQLDSILKPPQGTTKRAYSAHNKGPEAVGPLHVIPEERKEVEDWFGPLGTARRAFTDPIRSVTEAQRATSLLDQSPEQITPAPLNIRKRSGPNNPMKTTDNNVGPQLEPESLPLRNHEAGSNEARTFRETPGPPEVSEKKEPTIKKKKSTWFRRNSEKKDHDQESRPKTVETSNRLQIPEAWQGLDDRLKHDPRKKAGPSPDIGKSHATKRSETSASSEFPIRNCGTSLSKSEGRGGTFKGLLGFFGKKSKAEKVKHALNLGDNMSATSIHSNFDTGSEASEPARPGQPDYQMNWLSRFLHIKPVSTTLCFQVGRPRVRKNLLSLLRGWECHGVRDVSLSSEDNNVINARLDKNNFLNIKPVSLVIELFVICEAGQRTKLCCARFTQTRGAASSFRKTVDILEDICNSMGLLVTSAEVKANMLRVLEV
ncbi:Pkinase-domain-containing protein [Periconia macrospinosa]|uniref:non-specific serine/threonine protein kinase n=1 Tax=Periconia macrospinosa TaxID=97972 RepID=A0A2V1DM93_9PLEO|nr:Pkinase-domain-containing protein [Periconia macrospinosa]